MSLYARLKPGYQKRVVDNNVDLIRKIISGETKVTDRQITVSPTGSGKTFMMASVIESGLRLPQEPNFVWLTHNKQILLQTENEVRDALGGSVTTVYNIEQDIQSFGGRVLLFNVQKGVSPKAKQWLQKWVKFQSDFNRPTIFIVDEADEGMSGKNMQGLREVLVPTLELGFTASFVKKDGECEFQRVHYDEVIQAGMLTSHIEYQASDEVSRREMFDRAIAQRDYLEKLAEQLKVVDRHFVPKMLIQAPARDCESVARELQKRLGLDNKDFEKQVIVHTQNSRGLDEVEDMSNVRYIIGDLMVERGWNCPEAYVLLSTKESISERKGIQLLGRVIRLPRCEPFDPQFDMFNRGYVYISGKHSIEQSAKNFGADEVIVLPPPREVVQVQKREDVQIPGITTFIDELDKDIEDRDLIPISENICAALEEIRRKCATSDPSIRKGVLNLVGKSVAPAPSEQVQTEWNIEQTKKMLIDALSRHIPRNYANLVITKYQIQMKISGGIAGIAPFAREMADEIKQSSLIRRISEGLEYIRRSYEWPPHKLVVARPLPLEFARSLYPKMQLNLEEQRFATFLDDVCKRAGFWWVRNDVSDVKLFRGHSPDFIVFDKSRYLFIEYKGKHLLNTPDSVKKNEVGQKAAGYFMVYEAENEGNFKLKGASGENDETFTEGMLTLCLKAQRAR